MNNNIRIVDVVMVSIIMLANKCIFIETQGFRMITIYQSYYIYVVILCLVIKCNCVRRNSILFPVLY